MAVTATAVIHFFICRSPFAGSTPAGGVPRDAVHELHLDVMNCTEGSGSRRAASGRYVERASHTGDNLHMTSAKENVRRLLDELPDEATFEDIQYHIYVQEAVQRGLDAADRGELLDQEEVERRMAKWLGE